MSDLPTTACNGTVEIAWVRSPLPTPLLSVAAALYRLAPEEFPCDLSLVFSSDTKAEAPSQS